MPSYRSSQAAAILSCISPINAAAGTSPLLPLPLPLAFLPLSRPPSHANNERPSTHHDETYPPSREHYYHLFFRGHGRDDPQEPDTAVSVSGSVAAAAGSSRYYNRLIPALTQFRPGPAPGPTIPLITSASGPPFGYGVASERWNRGDGMGVSSADLWD
ncbi:hypothetical protein M422DRAFT_247687 [Sphaerobolus stellatus SS14]|nr:hypothetical protein M422DRAFT_247687 [Sphaerobolus stellatus SS14]